MIFIENNFLIFYKNYVIIFIESEEKPMNKKEFKKSQEELAEYLQFKRRGFIVPAKKGRGSIYKRNIKHKNRKEEI